MILYSIISPDDIFCTGEAQKTGFCAVNGGLVEYTEQDGKKTVRRLYSTDPSMYLDHRYSPSETFSGR